MIALLSDYQVPGGELPHTGYDVGTPVLVVLLILVGVLIAKAAR